MQPGNIIKGPYVLDFLGLKHEFSLYEKELEQLLISKCFLLIDLKTNELNHQDIGQMDFYVRYFDDKVRQKDDNPTIGLILCTKKDKTIVKYSLLNDSKQIFASKYRRYLPSEDELTRALEREKLEIESERSLQKAE
jgi:hypothetical protein